jgi:GNAT superfamily N-acetyltransferase
MTTEYELVSPTDEGAWRRYHDIRREVLFEARGRFGVYNENHPDDKVDGHHAKLLLHRGDPVGVVRIDISGEDAVLRRVAVCSDAQRRGHGRALLSLAQQFAVANGCGRLASHVAPDAVRFYEKCGFSVATNPDARGSAGESVFMTKCLKRPVDQEAVSGDAG